MARTVGLTIKVNKDKKKEDKVNKDKKKED